MKQIDSRVGDHLFPGKKTLLLTSSAYDSCSGSALGRTRPRVPPWADLDKLEDLDWNMPGSEPEAAAANSSTQVESCGAAAGNSSVPNASQQSHNRSEELRAQLAVWRKDQAQKKLNVKADR